MSQAAPPLCALALAILLAVPAHAQITNGSFEPTGAGPGYALLGGGSPTIPGWLTSDNGVEWFNPVSYGVGPAPSGNYIVDLACYTYSAGGLQQTFTTVPGQSYTISFYYGTHQAAGRDGTAAIVVSADGQTQTFAITNLAPTVNWELRAFTFVADNASATLSFRCLQNANVHFAYIDGVGVTAATPTHGTSWGDIKQRYR
jgi:hypothetical protein